MQFCRLAQSWPGMLFDERRQRLYSYLSGSQRKAKLGGLSYSGFIAVFSRSGTGAHNRAKLFELNYFERRTFLLFSRHVFAAF